MKNPLPLLLGFFFFIPPILRADVALSTVSVPSATIFQGTQNQVAYILQMEITGTTATLTNASIVSSGTYTAGEVDIFNLWRNDSPNLTGATSFSSDFTSTGAGETVTFNNTQAFSVGTHYLLVTFNLDAAATDGHTLQFDGGENPMLLVFSGSPAQTNNQSNLAGTLTFDAADVTLATEVVPAATHFQGTQNVLAYIFRLDVAGTGVTLSNCSIISSGTYDGNDIGLFRLWRNSSPSLTGATNFSTDFNSIGTGETVTFNTNQSFAIGTHYLLVTCNLNNDATDGNNIQFNGSANPASLTFSTSPNLTNNQSNLSGTQTFDAADVTLTTEVVPAATYFQGSQNVLAYIFRLDVAGTGVTLSNCSIISSGTYDGNDIGLFRLWRNSSPSLTGATNFSTDFNSIGTGETVTFNTNQSFAIGTHYLLVTCNLNNDATDGNNILFNGSANPASLTFSTSPNLTNNQSNLAGTQTFDAADVTLATEVVPAATYFQGTQNVLAYIFRLDVAGTGVTLSNCSIISSGTYDGNDIGLFRLWRNSSPSLTGATNFSTDFNSIGTGETVTFNTNQPFATGTHYLLVTFNLNNDATDGNNILFNGSANPASLTFSTSPNLTNNQSNLAGTQTFDAADVAITTEVLNSTVFPAGSTNNVCYILKLDVSITNVQPLNLQMITQGTYDSDDLDRFRLYRNASPTMSGASLVSSDFSSTGSGETVFYPISNQTFSPGIHYLLLTTDVDAATTNGNTIHFNGLANPATINFSTSPNLTVNQSNLAGEMTLGTPLPVELIHFQGETKINHNLLTWTTASEQNTDRFIVERSEDGRTFLPLGSVGAAGFLLENMDYSYTDFSPPAIAYYRLRMLDLNGSHEFSPIVHLEQRDGSLPRVYPSVFSQKIWLRPGHTGRLDITVFDVSGRVQWSGKDTQGGIDLGSLASGAYWVRIEGEGLSRPVVERVMKN